MTRYENIKRLLQNLPHILQVEFALYCAIDAKSNLKAGSKEEAKALICIDLIKKWLKDKNSLSNKELNDAASYASYAYSASNAASSNSAAAFYAASYASYASYAVSTSYAASSASHAVSASVAIEDKKYAQYEKELIRIIDSLSDLEKIIYKLENI